jgi:hypothetical protein
MLPGAGTSDRRVFQNCGCSFVSSISSVSELVVSDSLLLVPSDYTPNFLVPSDYTPNFHAKKIGGINPRPTDSRKPSTSLVE